ncbi:hypothetical protein AB0I28_09550 [Phytomonospora sp. NPDC050363]|uniref:hypothetical protein n=1 Tax=Phytomonospora sp. NPDC050363 TaxID=3155642 RepID=UPI0033E12A06
MPTPIRVILHVFQGIFLLATVICLLAVLTELLGSDGSYTWSADDELSTIVATLFGLLSIAFSPRLWSVEPRAKAAAPTYPQHPTAGYDPQRPPTQSGPYGG